MLGGQRQTLPVLVNSSVTFSSPRQAGSLTEPTVRFMDSQRCDPSAPTPHGVVLTGSSVAIPGFYMGART